MPAPCAAEDPLAMGSFMTTVIEPIVGHELSSDLTKARAALNQFYYAFNNRDMDAMSDNWDHTEQALMHDCIGGSWHGWIEIRAHYQRIFAQAMRTQLVLYDYVLHELADLFYVVGRERAILQRKSLCINITIRTTRMFNEREGRWKQVHYHGSIEVPSQLDVYQHAILGENHRWIVQGQRERPLG